MSSNRVQTAPDGGFGWVVVFGAFMQHVIALGVAYTLGVYYPFFIDEFNVPPSTAAWVAALHLGVLFGIGPVAGWLMDKIGTSGVSFIGSAVAAVGCISAAFAQSIYLVILCLGLIAGLGTGFMFISAVTAVSRWFEKKRALATGLAVSGAGIGIFLFSPLVRALLNEYDRNGALLIEGGLALQGCVFALLLRPVPSLRRKIAKEQNSTRNIRITQDERQDELVSLDGKRKHSIPTENFEITETEQTSSPTMRTILSGWMFWVFVISQFLTFLSASGPLVFLYNRAVKDLFVEPMHAAFLLSIMGIANTLGRLIFGALGNVFPASRLYLLSAAVMAYGLSTTFSTFGKAYWTVALFAVVFGAGYGCMFALTTVVLVDYFGITYFGKIYGNIGLFRGLACIIGPPLGGWLISQTGDEHSTLFIAKGLLGFVGGAALLLLPFGQRLKCARREINNNNNNNI